ncbi:hypothetical protein [Burkholderia sp. BE17]|uniref:hypothetical protein n=1 Tax=Burkholderia sp. BE17 TaxID=2656644 RepID=UPI00128E3FAF|nr:hypothetical protein [Burkholderia sp. BE17]
MTEPAGITPLVSHAAASFPCLEPGSRSRRAQASPGIAATRLSSCAATDSCCAGCRPCSTFAFNRVQPHSDTMHSLTSALAKSRPQFDARPQACAHPSVLPPPVAPPLVGAAPPPPAARAG